MKTYLETHFRKDNIPTESLMRRDLYGHCGRSKWDNVRTVYVAGFILNGKHKGL